MTPLIGVGIVLFILFLIIVGSGVFTVQQQTHAVVERFGRFRKISPPGLNFKWPIIETIAGRVGHRLQELEIKVESKTKDDVFVDILIAVQYYVPEDVNAVKLAFYKLTNPRQQISSYVFDTVRALVPDMAVDHVFAEKDKIAYAVKERLQETIQQFGFMILQSLVNDIQPDSKVKDAMNQVNASARLKEAAKNEAEARAKDLQGVGIARQRLAIANGLKESVAACSEAGISPEEATKMVLLTQHYDMLTAVGAHSKSIVMMVPYSPQGMSQVADQITAALLTSAEVEHALAAGKTPAKPVAPAARA